MQGSMGRQHLLNNNEDPPTKSRLLLAGDLVLHHKGAHHHGQRFFLEEPVVHLQIDMATGGNFGPVADCIEGWAHKL
jgi:hypothetical protein